MLLKRMLLILIFLAAHPLVGCIAPNAPVTNLTDQKPIKMHIRFHSFPADFAEGVQETPCDRVDGISRQDGCSFTLAALFGKQDKSAKLKRARIIVGLLIAQSAIECTNPRCKKTCAVLSKNSLDKIIVVIE